MKLALVTITASVQALADCTAADVSTLCGDSSEWALKDDNIAEATTENCCIPKCKQFWTNGCAADKEVRQSAQDEGCPDVNDAGENVCTEEYCCVPLCSSHGPADCEIESDAGVGWKIWGMGHDMCISIDSGSGLYVIDGDCTASSCCAKTCATHTCLDGNRGMDVVCPDNTCTDDLCCADACANTVTCDTGAGEILLEGELCTSCDSTDCCVGTCPESGVCEGSQIPLTGQQCHISEGCTSEYCCKEAPDNPLCSTVTCSEGKTNLDDITVDTDTKYEHCVDESCTDEQCCVAKCPSDFDCPEGTSWYYGGYCFGDTCTAEECCAARCSTSVSTFTNGQCGENKSLIDKECVDEDWTGPGKKWIACTEEICCEENCAGAAFDCQALGKRPANNYNWISDNKPIDETHCCIGDCNGYSTPCSDSASKEKDPSKNCADADACTEEECCHPKAFCSSYTEDCPEGTTKRDAGDMTSCGFVCTEASCCTETPTLPACRTLGCTCGAGVECDSGICNAGACAGPTTETCRTTSCPCSSGIDCNSGSCTAGACADAPPAAPCRITACSCSSGSDCDSGLCSVGACATGTADPGTGGNTTIDLEGSAPLASAPLLAVMVGLLAL